MRTTDDTPDWMKGWGVPGITSDPEPAPASPGPYTEPAWLTDARKALGAGDTALEDLPDLRRTDYSDRIALAQAHYLRAAAIALTESADHSETVADQLYNLHDIALAVASRRSFWTRVRGIIRRR